MKTKTSWMVGVLASLPLCSGVVFAQTAQPPRGLPSTPMAVPGGTTKLAEKDRQFVDKAATSNLAEIKTAQLALERASSPEVKRYAQMIIDDHQKAQSQLKKITQDEGLALPTQLTPEQQQNLDKLSKLQGPEFDDAFLKTMAKSHDDTVRTFQRAVNDVSDPALRAYAENTLPTLREHDIKAKQDLKNEAK
jgi:putative membrane protein